MRISVIIPSGRPDSVLLTIDALSRQDYGREGYEVILVTPTPDDDRLTPLRNVRIITVPMLYPPGKMRNIGAREACGEFLAFIDDDCIPDSKWLRQMVECLQKTPDITAVGCRVVSGDQTLMNRCADFCLFAPYQYRESRMIPLGSAALVLRRNSFVMAEGFDENLLSSEDWDFSLRLLEQGEKCFFRADVEVLHFHGRGTFSAILKGAYLYGYRSGLTVQRMHRSSMSWLARCALSLGSVWCYWLWIIPYSLVLTLMQIRDSGKKDPLVVLFVPMIFLSRFFYQWGVWVRLYHDRRVGKKGIK